MSEIQAREKLKSVSEQHLPDILTNLSIAFVIWLFGVLVFLPAAYQILPQRIPLATSLIILIGFSIFIARAIDKGLPILLDSASKVLVYDYKKRRKSQLSNQKLQPIIKSIVSITSLIILYLLYSPLLYPIHPSLNGLVLIPIILWIMWSTIRIINTLLVAK
jgi:hypothetical protein